MKNGIEESKAESIEDTRLEFMMLSLLVNFFTLSALAYICLSTNDSVREVLGFILAVCAACVIPMFVNYGKVKS